MRIDSDGLWSRLGRILVTVGLCASASAQVAAEEVFPWDSNEWLETLESSKFGRIHKQKKGALREWRLHGRADLQFGHLDSDQGVADEFELRRLRLGTSMKFYDDWRVKLSADVLEEGNVRYGGLLSAYVRYRPSKHLKLKLGKQVPYFTQEWSTPSMELGPVERSLLVEQVRPSRATGMNVEGEWKGLEYGLGVFSGDTNRGFGDFQGGAFWVANLGYDLTEIDLFDWWKDFDLSFSYLHNDGDSGNNAVGPYRHGFSGSVTLRKKQFRLTAEAIYADGILGRPDAWGFLVTPQYELIDDRLYLVMRYHYADSDGPDGLHSRGRYERAAPTLTDRGRGEEYHSFYLGLNCHLIEDRLLLGAGIEWARMKDTVGDGGDFDGLTALSVLRFAF